MQLLDQFEWDLSNSSSSPEEFSQAFAADLGLSGDFVTAIAHQIREQVQAHHRSLIAVGYAFNGTPVPSDELVSAFLPSLQEAQAFRSEPEAELHTPVLTQLTQAEIELQERERERESRRKKRQSRGRRGAVTLPDREPQKTLRTPAVYGWQIAAPETLSNLALSNVGPDRGGAGGATMQHSRRSAAAAAKAQMNEPTPSALPDPVDEAPKRASRAEDVRVYFDYPGGLGRGTYQGRTNAQAPVEIRGDASLKSRSAARPGSHRRNILNSEGPGRTGTSSPVAQVGAGAGGGAGTPSTGPAELAELDERLHPSWIDGVWHCANCGVPDSVAVGRRKGPTGAKTLCGPCGAVWNSSRKLRPVEYTTDVEEHLSQRAHRLQGSRPPTRETDADPEYFQEEEGDGPAASAAPTAPTVGGTGARSGPGSGSGHYSSATTLQEKESFETSDGADGLSSIPEPSQHLSSGHPGGVHRAATKAETGAAPEHTSPLDSTSGDPATPASAPAPAPAPAFAPAPAPPHAPVPASASTPTPTSSASASASAPVSAPGPISTAPGKPEAPVQAGHRPAQPQRPTHVHVKPDPSPGAAAASPVAASASASSPAPASGASTTPPSWLMRHLQGLRSKYPHDRFEPVMRTKNPAQPEWRMRCLDCPGKLYTPGPAETLANFEVHLKNRSHRANVAARLGR